MLIEFYPRCDHYTQCRYPPWLWSSSILISMICRDSESRTEGLAYHRKRLPNWSYNLTVLSQHSSAIQWRPCYSDGDSIRLHLSLSVADFCLGGIHDAQLGIGQPPQFELPVSGHIYSPYNHKVSNLNSRLLTLSTPRRIFFQLLHVGETNT